MDCISSNLSSFFLNFINDPSEFAKYLSNGELRFSSAFEDFPVYGQSNVQQQQHYINGGVLVHANGETINSNGEEGNSNIENTQPVVTFVQHYGSYQAHQQQQMTPQHHGNLQHQQQQTRWALPHQQASHQQNLPQNSASSVSSGSASGVATSGNQHFDGSFEFMKYLRHSNDNYSDSSHDGNGQHSKHKLLKQQQWVQNQKLP